MSVTPTVIEYLTEYPEAAVILGLLMRAGLAWQRELSWYEYRTLHGVKRLAFPALEALAPGTIFINDKRGRTDAEYLSTVAATPRQVARRLRRDGGSLHLLSSVKRRPPDHGDTLSRAHVVYTEGGDQTEAYLFCNDDGSTDVYAHAEASVARPVAHLTGPQRDGDPEGFVEL
jgi:hypothetical protein